ncbi:hypothetical protein Bca52824_046492 [Brassica carinata]|uniref:Uncharacterized protein n=1 Tax=Brassica carinata TaxID=52824 RepID=A0A8X7RFE6_BRACI|nr:hypothetical protein Bca52824_046492 [Brassica carinata]
MSLVILCEYSTIDRSILIECSVLDSQRRSLSIDRSDLDVGICSDTLSGAGNEAIDGVTGGGRPVCDNDQEKDKTSTHGEHSKDRRSYGRCLDVRVTESAPGVIPSKKKKKNKSSRKAVADFEGGKNLAETDQVRGDRSTNEADGSDDLTERDPAGSFGVKRKEPTGGSFPGPGEGKRKRSCDRSHPFLKEIALSASRLLPWGGSSPPYDRFVLVSSERWTFCHDKDASVVNNPDACSELVRRTQGGTHLMPVVPELAFSNGFIKSAQADMEAIVRQNQLILDYEQVLWRMSSDLSKAEAAIETKDAEIEKSKRDAQARGETPSSQPGFRDLRSDGHVGRLGDAEKGLIVSSLPRLEPLQGLNQFGSNLEIVDSEAVASLRYPALEVEHLAASLGRNSFDRAKTTVSKGRAAKLSDGTESAGATGAAVSDLVAEDQSP